MKIRIVLIPELEPTHQLAGPTPTGIYRRFIWLGYALSSPVTWIPIIFWHELTFTHGTLVLPDPWWVRRRVRPRRRLRHPAKEYPEFYRLLGLTDSEEDH